MTSSSEKTFNSLIYPIQKSIRWETGNIHFTNKTESDPVQIGKCEWKIVSKKGNGSTRLFYISCSADLTEAPKVHVSLRLVHRKKSEKDLVKEWDHSLDPKDGLIVQLDQLTPTSGFLNNGRIIVECLLRIDSEDNFKRRTIRFGERISRPAVEYRRFVLEKNKVPTNTEKIVEDVKVAEIPERQRNRVTLFGLPAYLTFQKWDNDLLVGLWWNWEDESKWWMTYAEVEYRIVNHKGNDLTMSSTVLFDWYSTDDRVDFEYDKLMEPSNGFIKNGKLKVEVSIRMLERYGFDETTSRGIDRPIRFLRDIWLNVNSKTCVVSGKALSHHSTYFRELFALDTDKTLFDIENVDEQAFIRFLELVHNVDTDICEDNAEGVLEIIDRFKAPKCFERIDVILKRQELRNPMKVLEWTDKYPLPGLKKTKEEKEQPIRYQFTTDFKEKTDLTDVKLEGNGLCYFANKEILAHASYFFAKRFYGPYADEKEDNVSDLKISSELLKLLLEHIYHPTTPVTSAQLDSLLELACQFQVLRLMDKCEEFLVLNGSIPLIDKLEYSGKYDLPYLLESCLKFVRNTETMAKVKADPKYRLLPQKIIDAVSKRENGDLEWRG